MVRTAGLRIILGIVIVNKVYEKGTKRVKFYLWIRFVNIFWWIRRLIGFLIGSFLGDLALCTRSPSRFIPLPEGTIVL